MEHGLVVGKEGLKRANEPWIVFDAGASLRNVFKRLAGRDDLEDYARYIVFSTMPPAGELHRSVTCRVGTERGGEGLLMMGESWTSIRLPENRLQFDEALFLRLLAACVSITKEDKRRVILGVPRLTQSQVDELMEIMADEVTDIKRTAWEWPEGLKRLQARQLRWWLELERELSH